MKDQVMVVGVDFTEEAKAAIEDGTYDATVAMSPYLMGREAVIMMLKALEGQEVTSTLHALMALVNADTANGYLTGTKSVRKVMVKYPAVIGDVCHLPFVIWAQEQWLLTCYNRAR